MTDQPHDFIGDDLEKAIVADDSPFSRPWLGASSIKDQAEAVFDRILRLKIFFIRYGSSATQDRRDGVKNAFAKIVRFVAEVSQKEEPEWLRESESVVPKLQEFENELRANLARFLVPALYDSGCFHDLEGLHREAERRVADAKDEIESIAAEQVDRVRDEVALLSVEEARKQFSEAQKKLDGRRRGWLLLSFAVLALAAWLAWKFYGHLEAKMLEKTAPGPGAATISAWDIIAHSAFRIFILSVVVGFSTYCLRVARAYMHMSELNQHRQRVAQSLVGLVQAAASRQVRDALVVDLVQSIVAFGNSGLIPGDDDTIGAQRTELSSLLIRQLAKPGSGGG